MMTTVKQIVIDAAKVQDYERVIRWSKLAMWAPDGVVTTEDNQFILTANDAFGNEVTLTAHTLANLTRKAMRQFSCS